MFKFMFSSKMKVSRSLNSKGISQRSDSIRTLVNIAG